MGFTPSDVGAAENYTLAMQWAEKIIGLHPAIVSGAFILTGLVSGMSLELAPLGSALSDAAFMLAALLSFGLIFGWMIALHTVAHSRLGSDLQTRKIQRATFVSAIGWSIAFNIAGALMPMSPAQIFIVVAIIALIAGCFTLRAVWHTTSSLLKMEKREDAFWTFVQILYFPLGVWFLQPRLKNLLTLPAQPTPRAP